MIRHPDIFTAEEAMEYLHIPAGETRTLQTLRESHGLRCVMVGRNSMYHRVDLDQLVERMWGLKAKSTLQLRA